MVLGCATIGFNTARQCAERKIKIFLNMANARMLEYFISTVKVIYTSPSPDTIHAIHPVFDVLFEEGVYKG